MFPTGLRMGGFPFSGWIPNKASALIRSGVFACLAAILLSVATVARATPVPASIVPDPIVTTVGPAAVPVNTVSERETIERAAQRARAEALRSVQTERVRLKAYAATLDRFGLQLADARHSRELRQEALLGWRQRTLEARNSRTEADRVYDALRRELRTSRNGLADTLTALSGGGSDIPPMIDDRIAAQAPESETARVEALRRALDGRRQALVNLERTEREANAAGLLGEVGALNQARLSLIDYLSPAKRRDLTGFTAVGFDQAVSEGRHLVLIARYHAFATVKWIGSVRHGDGVWTTIGKSAGSLIIWIVALAAFFWWRSTARHVLPNLEVRLQEKNRAELRTRPGPRLLALRLFTAVRNPLEWLIILTLLGNALPADVAARLEFQIIGLIATWLLVGAIIARLLDAIIGSSAPRSLRRSRESRELRLRSLRLLSGVIVGFILVLAITDRLVGQGTIYRWVASTCWFAAIPVFLILVGWWRGVVFARLERLRRRTPLQEWALSHRIGGMSFLAAILGATEMFVRGAWKLIRTVGVRFVYVRRAVAFVFRQELGRPGHQRTVIDLAPLPREAFDQLSPEQPGDRWIPTRMDPLLEKLQTRAAAGMDGIVVLVGERGSGKTAALKQLRSGMPGAELHSAEVLVATLDRKKPGPKNRPSSPGTPGRVMLIDDVESLVRFEIGGLGRFDTLVEHARQSPAGTLWILVVDEAVWPYLTQMRGDRSFFDEIVPIPRWTEAAIGELLHGRSAQAGLKPSFDLLIEDLPAEADEIDRQEALEAKSAAYSLLIWDYAEGNPGVALHLWREALGVSESGITYVRALHPAADAALDRLPLETLFVYRAVLRTSLACLEDVQKSTRLPETAVKDALRYGVSHGYLTATNGAYTVSWSWYRALTRSLERRHLIGAP
tara:strand:+ start:15286 stop:17997 length:2712 start_codon:yes stop_codon:yes gene_type:complete